MENIGKIVTSSLTAISISELKPKSRTLSTDPSPPKLHKYYYVAMINHYNARFSE